MWNEIHERDSQLRRRSINPARFGIKHSTKPRVLNGLSSTVLIDGTHYVDIQFTLSLVERAGKLLPRGCSVFCPAYMTMKVDMKTGYYLMYVQYVNKSKGSCAFELLVFKERPKWLKFMKPLPGTVDTRDTGKTKEYHDKDHQAYAA